MSQEDGLFESKRVNTNDLPNMVGQLVCVVDSASNRSYNGKIIEVSEDKKTVLMKSGMSQFYETAVYDETKYVYTIDPQLNPYV